MKRWAGPLVVLLIAAFPADALGDVQFRGKSGQDGLAILRTDDAGMAKRFRIAWRARCRRPGFRYANATQFLPPYDALARDRFVDTGSYRERLTGGARAVLNGHVEGTRVSAHRWRGIFRIRVRVFRGSRLIDRCYKRTAWRVLRRN